MKYLKWNRKYIDYIVDILGMICLSYVLLHFLDMADALYQAVKNIYAAKAILMLVIFMFINQRVKLFNWQSLVASLVYCPIGLIYGNQAMGSPDLLARDRVVALICWILILIAVDMMVYGKVNQLQRFHNKSLIIFTLMAVFMMYYRHERIQPIIFLVIFVFYLIPIDKERWKHILYQFCGAWVLIFARRLLRSLLENPEVAENGRWYGCFLNIGDFGLFVAAMVTVCLYLLYCAKQQYGRKSIPYIGAWILMLPVVWTALRVCTITMFIGIGCIFLMGFIICRKDSSPKRVMILTAMVIIGIPVVILGGLLVLRLLTSTDKEYWLSALKDGNAFVKPIAELIRRAHYLFEESRTFADSGVFEEGTLINYLDLLASGRLSIMKEFSKYFSFRGNGSFGIEVGTYFATNTHNAYTQFIFEYGYVGGGLFLLWMFYSMIMGAKQFLHKHEKEALLLCLWMAMVAGVMLGEMVYLYSPVIVMAMLLTYPLMIKMEET